MCNITPDTLYTPPSQTGGTRPIQNCDEDDFTSERTGGYLTFLNTGCLKIKIYVMRDESRLKCHL